MSARSLWQPLTAVLLALFLSYWLWVLFAPLSTPLLVSQNLSSNINSNKLFGDAVVTSSSPTTLVSESVVQAPLLVDARLVGVFASTNPKKSFAIFQLGANVQKSVALGDVVDGDIVLDAVNRDYVDIARAGIKQRISFVVNNPPDGKN